MDTFPAIGKTSGLIATDGALAHALAARLAAAKQRVLVYMTAGAPRISAMPGVEAAATPTDIAFECETVLSCVDDSLLFRDLLIGTKERMGFGAEMAPGATLIDLGVRPPRETQALLGVIGQRGVALIDAALIGPLSGLAHGGVTVLAGGFPDAVDTAAPLLGLFGRLERTGPLGSAHTSAALMGYIEAAHAVAHDEAVSVGRALGLSAETLADVLVCPATSADNIIRLGRRTALIRALAAERGVAADVVDFIGARLERTAAESR